MSNKSKTYLIDNPAKSFEAIVAELKNIASEKGVSVKEAIIWFISDLKNINNKEYENKIIPFDDIDRDLLLKIRENLISYLNKVLKRFDDTERKERKREKQKAKRDEKKAKQEVCDTIFEEIKENINSSEKSIPDYIRAIISDINDGNTYPELDTEQKKYLLNKLSALLENEEKIKLDKDKKIKRILEQANLLVDEKAKTTELKLKYWKFLKDDINSEDGQIRIPKSVKKEVEDLIDLKVNEISDLLYYEQVKYFTRDFSFLREYSEIVQANKGHSDRKFTDFESYKRFHNLSGQLQKGNDEYKQIQFMLKTDNIDKMDRAILNERIKVLEREHADQTIR